MKPEQQLMNTLEAIASKAEIVNAAKYINLYYSVFTPDSQLWNETKKVFNNKYNNIFDMYSKDIIANKFINELLLRHYPCERTVKSAIVNSLKCKQDTVLFEMPVLDSRIDVCRINGNSFAYEIKTEFDTFKRLKKQLDDYSKIYEYIFVVVPQQFYKEVLVLIPEFCGVQVFSHDRIAGGFTFYTKRKATKSPYIDPNLQLGCLSKDILGTWMSQKKIKKIPPTKAGRISLLMNKYCAKTINTDFKHIVKQAYKSNWEFILDNYNAILPIDIQAFFSNPLDPNLLYLKDNNYVVNEWSTE